MGALEARELRAVAGLEVQAQIDGRGRRGRGIRGPSGNADAENEGQRGDKAVKLVPLVVQVGRPHWLSR